MRKNWLETACVLLASVVVAGTAGQAQAAPALPTAGSQASSQELRSSVQYRPGIVYEDEEAAAVSGAGWLRTMTRIVMPQIRLGLLAAWVVTFVLAFGELGVSILVAPPGEATLPIRIYTIIANAPSSQVAALALLQITVVLVPVAVLAAAVSWRPATPRHGGPGRAEESEAR